MHYKNGRPANNGDKVVLLGNQWNAPVAGILYNAVVVDSNCIGRIAPTSPNDPCPNLANCLHADDIAQATSQLVIVPLVTDNPVS